MRTRPLALLLLLSLTALAEPRDAESIRKWREDLAVFQREFPRRHHRDLLFHLPPAELDRMLAALREDVPKLAEHEIKVRLAAIVAKAGDRHGHTRVSLTNSSAGFHLLPVNFYLYTDGLFIRAAAKEHAGVVGARVVAIGETPADEAFRRVLTIAAGDNDFSRRAYAQELVGMPEVLRALRIVRTGAAADPVPLQLELPDGTKTAVTIAGREKLSGVEWVDVRASAKTTPLFRRHPPANPYAEYIPSKHFWFAHVPESRLLYVHYAGVQDTKEKSVAEFFTEVFAYADTQQIEKFVIDVRVNGGGNNMLNAPIFRGLAARAETLAKQGRFFVIIGRTTFSAAQNFVNVVDRDTAAIFVGEPTGGSPNHYGDATSLTLPNSRLIVRASTLWWQDAHPQDPRPWVAPEIAAEFSSADDREGRDPALEAILRYVPAPPLASRLREALARGGKEEALKVYRAWRAEPVTKYVSAEDELVSLGVSLFASNVEHAVAIFELNAEVHPRSWRALEALGRAYAGTNRRDAAIAAYEKALAIEPDAVTVLDRLEKLRGGS